MSNFFDDNEDLQFYVDKWIKWEPLVSLTEYQYRTPDGFKSAEEALPFYKDVATLVGQFVADEIAPKALELDEEGSHLGEDGEARGPAAMEAIFESLAELELHGMCLPRELGGMNCPLILYFINAEMLARADVSTMTHHSFHGGMAMAMLAYSVREGSTEFNFEEGEIASTRFADAIEEIRTGAAWGCMDITEPDAGSDMAALRAQGFQDAAGNWFVRGQKIFITSGHGKYHFAIARTEDAQDPKDPMAGLKGLSMFLVPAWTDNDDGTRTRYIHIDRLEEKLGHHGSATCALTYDDAPAMLIGERGEGFSYMLTLMNNARVGVGFESLGLCEAAYRAAKAFAAERVSMGKTIDRHEMIADYLDEMKTDIHGIRALAMEGAYNEEMAQKIGILLKSGILSESDAAHWEAEQKRFSLKSRKVTPLLKYLASEKAVELAQRAIQIHGGAGYITEYGVGKLLRDAMAMPIYEGTSQIQSLMAMKDSLGFIMKDPQAFVRDSAQAEWQAIRARDPLEKGTARLRGLVLGAQRHLIKKTALDKAKKVEGYSIEAFKTQFIGDWDIKRDFAWALLHAERLTRLLADAAIADLLLEQVKAHPERRPILKAHLERALPRGRYLHDLILRSGERILADLDRISA